MPRPRPEEAQVPAPGLGEWFADEVQPHASPLRHYLRGAFPAVRDVDDVVQESCLRVWRARAEQPIRSARAFLFTVARRLALNLLRKERRSPIEAVADLSALPVACPAPDAAAQAIAAEQLELLAGAIAALPPRAREIVILCKIDGRSHRAVAAQLGIAEKTVDEHLWRALKRLGTMLDRAEAGRPGSR